MKPKSQIVPVAAIRIGYSIVHFRENRWASSMLVTDVGDEMLCDYFKMLVTVLAILVTNILYRLTLALGTNNVGPTF